MRNQKKMLGKAILIATQAHNGQFDRGGNPYILHPYRVMSRLVGECLEIQQAAILHDVVEDSDITIEDLRKEGFSERVLHTLSLLTKVDGQDYDEYIQAICECYDAIVVKMEDIKDNSDITRLKGLTEKDFKRMEKYQRSFVLLKSELEKFK